MSNFDNIKSVIAKIKYFIPDADLNDQCGWTQYNTTMALIRQDNNTPAAFVYPLSPSDKWNQTFDSISDSIKSGNKAVAQSACDQLTQILNSNPLVGIESKATKQHKKKAA